MTTRDNTDRLVGLRSVLERAHRIGHDLLRHTHIPGEDHTHLPDVARGRGLREGAWRREDAHEREALGRHKPGG